MGLSICLVNYAHPFQKPGLYELQEKQNEHAIAIGEVDNVTSFRESFIHSSPFYLAHKELLDTHRGAGLYAWKPYCILSAMAKTEFAYDVYIYLDVDIEIKSSLRPFAELTRDQDVVAARNTYRHISYCKRETSDVLQAWCEGYEKWYSLYAGVVCYTNRCRAITFLIDWLTCVCNHKIIDESPSTIPDPPYPVFVAHRHDQSIFTILYHKYGYKVFPPSILSFSNLYPLSQFERDQEQEGLYTI